MFKECKGEEQSPINIEKNHLTYSPSLGNFEFFNYNQTYNWNLTHDGHTSII